MSATAGSKNAACAPTDTGQFCCSIMESSTMSTFPAAAKMRSLDALLYTNTSRIFKQKKCSILSSVEHGKKSAKTGGPLS